MDEKPEIQKWKLIGGGIIVAVAFAIMMPGVIDYIGRIGRVLLLVVVAVSIALAVVVARHKLMAAKAGTARKATAPVVENQVES